MCEVGANLAKWVRTRDVDASRAKWVDDIPLAAAASPPLTTVRQPMAEMGCAMAAALLEMVDDGGPRPPQILPTEIIRRRSV